MVNVYIQKRFICVEYCQNYILKNERKKMGKGRYSVIFYRLSKGGAGCDMLMYKIL